MRSYKLVLALAFALPAAAAAQQPAAAAPGKATYEKWCSGCHGLDGKGKGPAANWMLPRPRDFTQALYQIRTTETGGLPTDADIRHVIDEGMPGTAMPGWKTKLSEAERNELVEYLKAFSPFFKQAKEPAKSLTFTKATSVNDDVLKKGKDLYTKVECFKCHGRAGRGDGQSASTQDDDAGNPIRPADLTEPWYFNGGGTVEDIYRRLRTGLDGTPMPTFSDLITSKVTDDDGLWAIAHYVHSLAPETPRVRDVVRASEITGNLPTAPNDSAWNQAERFYIPLVGQIVVKPRWFAPTVDGVWVQALHNGTDLALRVTWHDPSKSPDPEWNEWQGKITSVMEPHEDGGETPAPSTGAATTTAPAPAAQPSLPDMLVVQFPPTIPTGMERPYFLMGNSSKPVYLWKWQSDTNAVVEATGKGYGNMTPLSGGQLTGSASFDQGEWTLVMKRPIVASDSAGRLNFRPGVAIPMALFAWDGNNGEHGTKSSISTWYYIYLDQKTPKTVYATPIATIAITAALGLLFVRNAQKKKDEE
jgi:mono/diheme cytochrome c family protein